jgi:hypothetical protein
MKLTATGPKFIRLLLTSMMLLLGSESTSAQVLWGDSDHLHICIIKDGVPAVVEASFYSTSSDTLVTVGGKPRKFSVEYPLDAQYASHWSHKWFAAKEIITFSGKKYAPSGPTRILASDQIQKVGTYDSVSIFAETGSTETPYVIFLPVNVGCVYQPYTKTKK